MERWCGWGVAIDFCYICVRVWRTTHLCLCCQALLRFGVPDDGRARTMVLDCPRCGATLRIKMKPVQQKGMTHSASDQTLLRTAAALGGGDSLDDSVRRAMSSSKNLD